MAEDLRRIAEELRQGGSQLLSATADAWSYDGQYAPWVQSIASDGDHRTRTFSERIASLAHTLDRIAQAFEEADRLDHTGFPHLADQFRTVIESGYDFSSFPLWLIRGQSPPWIKQGLWDRLPLDDRDAILSFVGEDWLGFARSGGYSHGTDQDIWNAFTVYLFMEGILGEPPGLEVWNSAAMAAGKDLAVYISEMTGIKQTRVEAWFRAAETHGFSQEFAIQEMATMAQAGESIEDHFGFSLDGNWTEADQDMVVESVLEVSHAMAEITQGSPHEAFRLVYGTSADDPLIFGWGNCPECNGLGGYTYGRHLIKFASLSPISELRRRNNIVHELGHAFHWAMVHNGVDPDPYRMLEITQNNDPTFPNRLAPPQEQWSTGPNYGFASPQKIYTWQQNPSEIIQEEFADQFLGWTFNEWETDEFGMTTAGQLRSDWMDQYMSLWVNSAVNP